MTWLLAASLPEYLQVEGGGSHRRGEPRGRCYRVSNDAWCDITSMPPKDLPVLTGCSISDDV